MNGRFNFDVSNSFDFKYYNLLHQSSSENMDKNDYHGRTMEPSSPSDLHHPLLRLNRTGSDNSSEGNTIDMVRLQRRRQQGRITKVNNYRQLYNNYNQGNGINNANRHHQCINKDDPVHSPQANSSGNKNPSQYSPSNRLVLQSSQKNFFRSTFRPSQMNLLHEIDGSARNRVIGWLLMVVFIIVYLQLVLLCGIVLSEGYLSDGSNNTQAFETMPLFTTALFTYSLSQCLYHLAIYLIQSKSDNHSRNSPSLIDRQAASLEYILKCRDFTSQHSSLIQRVIKSPKFTITIIMISAVLLGYGSVECFYHSQISLLYWTEQQGYQEDSITYSLFEILFYLMIMPDVMCFVFFQQMHLVHQSNSLNSSNSNNHNQHQSNIITTPFDHQHHDAKRDSFSIPPLTVFNIHSWWVKMSLGILLIAIVYSLVGGKWWLGVVVFAKLELSFVKSKYRIDMFWVELVSEGIIVVASGIVLMYDWWGNIVMGQTNQQPTIYNNNAPFSNFIKFMLATITITISILLSRLLASHYLREQLYKHLFPQMQILICTMMGSILISYFLYQYVLHSIPIDYISILFVIIMQTGLFVSVCIEGKRRQQIDLDMRDNLSQNCQIEMHHYQI